jgi:hypothetical protein
MLRYCSTYMSKAVVEKETLVEPLIGERVPEGKKTCDAISSA